MKRVFLIVLDSFGVGELPDAAKFGDTGANTLRSVAKSQYFNIPNLIKSGLGNIDGVDCIEKSDVPCAAFGKCAERSAGKDTTVGHWEIAGLISNKPLAYSLFLICSKAFLASLIRSFSQDECFISMMAANFLLDFLPPTMLISAKPFPSSILGLNV